MGALDRVPAKGEAEDDGKEYERMQDD